MSIQTRMKKLLLVAVVSGVSIFANAQPPGDPGADPGGSVPIDGGLTLLVAAGIGYAAKKKHDSRKNKAKQQDTDGGTMNL